MKLLLVLIMSIMLIPSVVFGSWSEVKTARELAFFHVLANDWQQTLDMSRNPICIESNKILGKKPSQSEVNIYFASCAIGHTLISYFLPENYSKVWQLAWIGIQSNQVDMNNNSMNNSSYLVQNMEISYEFKYTIKF